MKILIVDTVGLFYQEGSIDYLKILGFILT